MAKKTKTEKKTEPLTPPDFARCQAERREGSFMTLGPRSMVRCTNRPTMLAVEKKSGADGQVGSMTICDSCFDVMQGAVRDVHYERIKTALDHGSRGQLMKPAALAEAFQRRAGVLAEILRESDSLTEAAMSDVRQAADLLMVLAGLYASEEAADKQLAYTLTACLGRFYAKLPQKTESSYKRVRPGKGKTK